MINWVKRILTHFKVIFSCAYYTYFTIRNKIRIIGLWSHYECISWHLGWSSHDRTHGNGRLSTLYVNFNMVFHNPPLTLTVSSNKQRLYATPIISICISSVLSNTKLFRLEDQRKVPRRRHTYPARFCCAFAVRTAERTQYGTRRRMSAI